VPWNSCHSVDSKRAWVKRELIRYVRICLRALAFARIRRDFKTPCTRISTSLVSKYF
ncbi:hypothetical protein C8J57DRAFT_1071245, partial [Mycena rebaudengoi]